MVEKPLFILEMANNHMGDISHGLKIIEEFGKVTKACPFCIAFKFQYRNLDTFIHKSFRERKDIPYVKRFSETHLTEEDFLTMKSKAHELGFQTICTPFDEDSVRNVVNHSYDFIKIASASLTDWPLLEEIVKHDLPVIASTGGASLDDIDRVVSFFEHREKGVSLMHCIPQYPTDSDNQNLGQISFLKKRYSHLDIGLSTHEDPGNYSNIAMAIAAGAMIFEKHVGVSTDLYRINKYSSNPEQVAEWLKTAVEAFKVIGKENEKLQFSNKMVKDLHSLQRAMFAKKDILKGDELTGDNVYFAFPPADGQLRSNQFSAFCKFTSLEDIPKDSAIYSNQVDLVETRGIVNDILEMVKTLVNRSGLLVPRRIEAELSHHYGIEKFYETGITILNYINREYCKKVLVLLPNQSHPEQYHKIKEETFHIIYGNILMSLNGQEKLYKAGDIVVVERGVCHKFSSKMGAIVEEISTAHIASDSYYTDQRIMRNKNRKTLIRYWGD